jgi:transcription elongation factor Elf1
MSNSEVEKPVKIYKCPNCSYLNNAKDFKVMNNGNTIICPRCGIHFSYNCKYISESTFNKELNRLRFFSKQ